MLTKAEHEYIHRQLEAGKSANAIAKVIGHDRNSILGLARRFHQEREREEATKLKTIIALVRQNLMADAQIARIADIDQIEVASWRRRVEQWNSVDLVSAVIPARLRPIRRTNRQV